MRPGLGKEPYNLPGKTLGSHFLAMQQYHRSRSALSVHVQAGLSELHLLVNSGKKQELLHSESLFCLSRFTSQAGFDVDCDATRLAAPRTVVKRTPDAVN